MHQLHTLYVMHAIYKLFIKNVTTSMDIEMIKNVTQMELYKQGLLEDKKIAEEVLLCKIKKSEIRQNEKNKHNFRSMILRCIKQHDENKTFLGFKYYPTYEESFMETDYPLNYDFKTCYKFKKLKSYINKKGIRITKNIPIKRKKDLWDPLVKVCITYNSKKKYVSIHNEFIFPN